MSMTVSLSNAKTRLGELAERAARGEEIIIQRRGKPPVALVSKREVLETPEQLGARLAEQLGSRHRLTPDKQARLELLAEKNQAATLSPAEQREMSRLLREFGQLTVQRAAAISDLP